ncbi:MAG TPA: hypothetical protein ENK85_08060 [Saprospiraceae bacterium]|nr:hypothetical protein [Saprospiraceae bacterium]
MKKSLLVLFVGLLLVSCRKNNERAFLFEMEYPVDFTINAGIGPFVSHYFEIQDILTFSDSLFAFHEVDPATIESILPQNGRMVAVYATGVEYDFIKSIDVELYDEVNGSIKRLPAYYRDPVPEKTGSQIDLVSEEADLKEFMLKDHFNCRIRLQLYGAAPQTIESRLILKFAVR